MSNTIDNLTYSFDNWWSLGSITVFKCENSCLANIHWDIVSVSGKEVLNEGNIKKCCLMRAKPRFSMNTAQATLSSLLSNWNGKSVNIKQKWHFTLTNLVRSIGLTLQYSYFQCFYGCCYKKLWLSTLIIIKCVDL